MAQKTIEMDPNNAAAYSLLGMLYVTKAEYDKAVEVAERGASMNPNSVTAVYLYGSTLMHARRCEEAIPIFEKAIGIEWSNGNGWRHLGIGAADCRRKGYGTQSMQMLLRFAFAELNLFRVSTAVQEYNVAAIALLKKFGFVEEVRRRQALDRDGRRWDLIIFGLLKDEDESG